jgi:DNA-binding NarL/FixJ family response regulator
METKNTRTTTALQVLIVDDHRLLRDGLKVMLLSFKNELPMNVLQAATPEKAMQYVSKQLFDIAIVDFQLGESKGDELIKMMLRIQPTIKILALSNYSERKIIDSMMNAGALGFVLKSILPEQLLQALHTILKGKNYYCNEVAVVLLTEDESSAGAKKVAKYKLTAREVEVLLLIAEGMSNAEIAHRLFLARRTIDTHRQNLMRKLNVHNTAGLVRFALEVRP